MLSVSSQSFAAGSAQILVLQLLGNKLIVHKCSVWVIKKVLRAMHILTNPFLLLQVSVKVNPVPHRHHKEKLTQLFCYLESKMKVWTSVFCSVARGPLIDLYFVFVSVKRADCPSLSALWPAERLRGSHSPGLGCITLIHCFCIHAWQLTSFGVSMAMVVSR